MSIRLQFVLGTAWSSQVIAWFSAGHFSHVDAVLPDGNLLGAREDSVGGYPQGVHVRDPHYDTFIKRVLMTVPATEEQEAKFYAFLYAQIGKPYDYAAEFAFILNRDWRQDDKWICSELVAAAGEAAGILPKLYLSANKITPVACALAYSAVGGTTES